jgi:hypothetical protein
MTTSVTCATRFLGSHIAGKLVKMGERVGLPLRKTGTTANIEDIEAERFIAKYSTLNGLKRLSKYASLFWYSAGSKAVCEPDFPQDAA